jgi:hypothetical protein
MSDFDEILSKGDMEKSTDTPLKSKKRKYKHTKRRRGGALSLTTKFNTLKKDPKSELKKNGSCSSLTSFRVTTNPNI